MGFFQDRFLQTTCLGWLRTMVLLISASWGARITGVSHWCLASLRFWWKLWPVPQGHMLVHFFGGPWSSPVENQQIQLLPVTYWVQWPCADLALVSGPQQSRGLAGTGSGTEPCLWPPQYLRDLGRRRDREVSSGLLPVPLLFVWLLPLLRGPGG
jgi:hypothetical protein